MSRATAHPHGLQRRGRLPTSTPPIPFPPSNNDYATLIDEPGTTDDPDDSAYLCIWGPGDLEQQYDKNTQPIGTPGRVANNIRGFYPTLIRIIVDVRDEDGKLAEPVTQELVYRVPDELPPIDN